MITLLSIEALMLILVFNLVIDLRIINTYIYLAFIALSACEGALGLSILVALSRIYRSDHLALLNFIKYDWV